MTSSHLQFLTFTNEISGKLVSFPLNLLACHRECFIIRVFSLLETFPTLLSTLDRRLRHVYCVISSKSSRILYQEESAEEHEATLKCIIIRTRVHNNSHILVAFF